MGGLKDIRVAQQVGGAGDDLPLCGKLENGVLVFAAGQAEEEGGFLLALKLANCPFFPDGLLFVKAALQRVVDFQKLDDVRPAQKVRQRRTFWVSEVKLADSDHIAAAKTLSVALGEIAAQVFQQCFSVIGTNLPALFKLHDVMANLPVGGGDVSVDGLRGPHLSADIHLGDFPEQALVAVVCSEIAAAHAWFITGVMEEVW